MTTVGCVGCFYSKLCHHVGIRDRILLNIFLCSNQATYSVQLNSDKISTQNYRHTKQICGSSLDCEGPCNSLTENWSVSVHEEEPTAQLWSSRLVDASTLCALIHPTSLQANTTGIRCACSVMQFMWKHVWLFWGGNSHQYCKQWALGWNSSKKSKYKRLCKNQESI